MSRHMKLKEQPGSGKVSFCVEFEITSSVPSQGTLDLFLTFNAYEEVLTCRFGEIHVGLRKLRLELGLCNATMPLGTRQPQRLLSIGIKKKRMVGRETSVKVASDSKSTVGAELGTHGPKANVSAKSDEETTNKVTDSTEDEFEVREHQFSVAGNESGPVWHIEDKTESKFLEGALSEQSLGKLVISREPCQVTAEFKAAPRDLWIEGKGGIFPTEMNGSHRAIRALVVYGWLGSRVRPCLSRKHYEVPNV